MSEFDIQVTEDTEHKVLKLAKWMKLISIISFIILVILSVYGIYVLFIKETPNSSGMDGGAIVALMVAFCLFIPSLMLFLSSKNLNDSIVSRAQSQFDNGIKYIISYFVSMIVVSFLFFTICGLAVYYSD
jgi:hydrogenase-4 membrane subunit HyfE